MTCGKSVVEENLTPAKRKVKKKKNPKKVEFENANKHGKKNFPELDFTSGRKKCSALSAPSIRRYTMKRAGFRCDSLMSHEKSHSRYFCFQRAKNIEKPEQALLQRISHKIDKESEEKLEKPLDE